MKQLIYCYLCLKVFIKAITGIFLVATGSSQLPGVVFGVSAIVILTGAVIAMRYTTGRAKTNEIAMFFLGEIIATIFNLAFVSSASLVQTGLLDMVLTGSLLDIIIAAIAVFVLFRGKADYVDRGIQGFSHQSSEVSSKTH